MRITTQRRKGNKKNKTQRRNRRRDIHSRHSASGKNTNRKGTNLSSSWFAYHQKKVSDCFISLFNRPVMIFRKDINMKHLQQTQNRNEQEQRNKWIINSQWSSMTDWTLPDLFLCFPAFQPHSLSLRLSLSRRTSFPLLCTSFPFAFFSGPFNSFRMTSSLLTGTRSPFRSPSSPSSLSSLRICRVEETKRSMIGDRSWADKHKNRDKTNGRERNKSHTLRMDDNS